MGLLVDFRVGVRQVTKRLAEAAGLLWMCLGIARVVQTICVVDPVTVDFHGFYASGFVARTGQLWAGDPPYPNFNSPVFADLLAPLSLLPIASAWWIWTLAGALSLTLTLWTLWRAGLIRTAQWPWVIGALGLCQPAIQTWWHGQVTWLLLYPITRAWLSRSAIISGLWLAPVIALKPPLALIAVLLPLRTALTAAAVSAAISLTDAALFGFQRWWQWVADALGATGLREPANASYFGVASRLQFGWSEATVSLADVSVWWWMGWGCLGALAVWLAIGAQTPLRRWIVALSAGTFLQPLGWTYYIVWWLGPMLAVWRTTPVSIASVVLLTEPVLILTAVTTSRMPALNLLALSQCAIGLVTLAATLYTESGQRRASPQE
ncbi:MAG TPA: glycosyltransferase 87 family protein [Vicinamibacterales bacterium]|nr:glycosyltransferase 87 family protein [Vicinamibacterales bacterium]